MKVKLRLREIAEEKGLTLSYVQRKSELTMGMVRRYWHNQTSSVKLDALGSLASLLDVNPKDLIGEDDSEEIA